MDRRRLLRRLIATAGALPLARVGISAEAAEVFTAHQKSALQEVAFIVLPSALGRNGSAEVASRFEQYVREYRAGADTEHGYGETRVVPKPASPAAFYAKQLSALPSPVTQEAIEKALDAAELKELPRVPAGKSVIADLMSFYFRSSEANDLCYAAAIGRDRCRGLAGSDRVPAPLRSQA